MGRFSEYLNEIKERERQGLSPKPINDGILLEEIISIIKDPINDNNSKCINFFIYNVLPGTTSASEVKSTFLKEIILDISLDETSQWLRVKF